MALSLAELQKAQAEVEGFQNGPQPALNPANLNTQAVAGNPQPTPPAPPPVPYYPSQETPNLHLSTRDMPSELANNFVTLDKVLVSNFPILQARLDASATRVAHTLTYVATRTTLFTTSVFLESEGDGLVTDTVVGTLTFTEDEPTDSHTFTFSVAGGPSENITMETYPVLVEAGTVITFAPSFSAGVLSRVLEEG